MTCFFGHKWSKWKRYHGVMEVSVMLLGKKEQYQCEYQERVCQRCGKVEVEEIRPK